MTYLVDSNILLRLIQKKHPHHRSARNAVVSLRKQGEEICIVPQNFIEVFSK